MIKNLNTAKEKVKNSKFLIFDMDGTLVDMEDLNYETFHKVITSNYDIEFTRDDFKHYIAGRTALTAFADFLGKIKGFQDVDPEFLRGEFLKYKLDILKKDFFSHVTLKPGVDKFIEEMKREGKLIYLATSARAIYADMVLEKFSLKDKFAGIVSGEDVNVGKPDPEAFLIAMNKLKELSGNKSWNEKDAIIFEDSKSGIEAGKRAGIFTIAIYTSGMNDEFVDLADACIDDYGLLL